MLLLYEDHRDSTQDVVSESHPPFLRIVQVHILGVASPQAKSIAEVVQCPFIFQGLPSSFPNKRMVALILTLIMDVFEDYAEIPLGDECGVLNMDVVL